MIDSASDWPFVGAVSGPQGWLGPCQCQLCPQGLVVTGGRAKPQACLPSGAVQAPEQ